MALKFCIYIYNASQSRSFHIVLVFNQEKEAFNVLRKPLASINNEFSIFFSNLTNSLSLL